VLEVVSDRKLGQLLYEYIINASSTGTHVYNAQSNEYIYVGTGGNFDQSGSTTEVNYDLYLPEVMSYSDYYPFLMKIPGRYDNAAGYRYQGQGQEEDNEFTEGMLAFEYRVHDPRIGRFLSVDPLRYKYAYNSPYSFSENRVIDAIELEGMEKFVISENNTMPGVLELTLVDEDVIFEVVDENGVSSVNFKYKFFQKEMKNWKIWKTIEGTSLRVPNLSVKSNQVYNNDIKNPEDNFHLHLTCGEESEGCELVSSKTDPYHSFSVPKDPEYTPGLNDIESDFDTFVNTPAQDLNGTLVSSIIPEKYDVIRIYFDPNYTTKEAINGELEKYSLVTERTTVIYQEKPMTIKVSDSDTENNSDANFQISFEIYE
jgi:RHS repeat-associated protein